MDRLIYISRCLLVLLVVIGCNSLPQEEPACSAVLNYIQKNLPHFGVLKNSDGFVYVDLDNEYVHELIRFIQKDGFEEPPYFGSSDLIGAHITVADREEMEQYRVETIQECGETIYFTPQRCQVVHPSGWKKIDEVYLVVIEAPELDLIREKYGLPKRKYDFHITIGVKPKLANSA